jgi:hypothetical protein
MGVSQVYEMAGAGLNGLGSLGLAVGGLACFPELIHGPSWK